MYYCVCVSAVCVHKTKPGTGRVLWTTGTTQYVKIAAEDTLKVS